MSSQARIDASRANGAKSRGPITPEGKLASSRNSLKHGLLAKTVVLAGESKEDFIALLVSYQEEHQPKTPTEETLIENMAAARWRQQRVWNLETAGLDQEIRTPRFPEGEDFPTQAFNAFVTLTDKQRSFELLSRYEVRHERQFRNSLAALQKLRANRVNPPVDADERFSPTKLWLMGKGERPEAATDTHPEPDDLGSFDNHAPEPVIAAQSLIIRSITKVLSAPTRFYPWRKLLFPWPNASRTFNTITRTTAS